MKLAIRIVREGIEVPRYRYHGDAGLDLQAAEDLTLAPGGYGSVGTGIQVAIPDGFVGLIMPRSGIAARCGLTHLAGVVDSGYRGELHFVLFNADGTTPFEINRGARLGQLVVVPHLVCELVIEDVLPPSDRGEHGLGSST